jgi:predicted extracellular nuclease
MKNLTSRLNKTFKLTGLILLLFYINLNSQNNFRMMFYNVENLFDTIDDKHKNDNEFLPDGIRHWTLGRYKNKLNNLARVISTAGEGWEIPAMVGVCEVENDKVLTDLTLYSSLKKWKYKFVVTDSPDDRGIDVGLLYQPDRFKLLNHQSYRLVFPYNPIKKTRDILHVTGLVSRQDTIDVFVCHFPSRRDGAKNTEPDRIYAASVVKSKIDSLMSIRQNACIIIMGDFNDEPSNKSICKTLGALPVTDDADFYRLYNLFAHFEKQKNKGSYKFRRTWNMLDQIIVSGNMINRKQNFKVLPHTAQIFSRDYMLTEDTSHGGKRPKKTFYSYKHEGGYSDHLPIISDFSLHIKSENH